jgi:hypothetical protein
MDYPLPARVFTVDRGREHYSSVTVGGYRGIEKLGIAKSHRPRQAPRRASATDTHRRAWVLEERVHGAITYAVFKCCSAMRS